jgi:glycosyltransferase involved in cell wall biosynthesis
VLSEALSNGQMPKIKVLVFASSFNIGGSERQALELFRNLDRAKVDSRLASFSTKGPLVDLLPCTLEQVQTFPLDGFLRKSFMDHALRLYRYLKIERIDVVQCFDFYSNLFAIPVARVAGVPVILAARREESTIKTPLQRWVQRKCYGFATGVIANAHSIREAVINEEHVDSHRVWAIPNGLDVQAFDEQTRKAKPSGTGSHGKELRIAVVASLRPEKGHGVFLGAVAILAPRYPDAEFLIAGDGPMRGQIETQIDQLGLQGRVHLLGAIRAIPEFLKTLDCLVLPSVTNEGFPNAVMEAMAAGLPVVATDTGGTRDLVIDGDTGFVVRPKNVEELAARLETLCRDAELRCKMGEAGRWRVVNNFTTQHMARQYEDLYKTLLSCAVHPKDES